jgi:hypothetical protein
VTLPPASNYGRCPCGGVYEQRVVEVRVTVGNEVVTLVDVPQGACPLCDSRVYKVAMLEGIEAMMRSELAPATRLVL